MAAARRSYTNYGCGKTILYSLWLRQDHSTAHSPQPPHSPQARLYPIDAGAMRIDGRDICAAPLLEARAAARLVAQASSLTPTAILTIWLYDLLVLTYDLVLTFLLYYGHAYSCT